MTPPDAIAIIAARLGESGGGAARSAWLQPDIYRHLGLMPTLFGMVPQGFEAECPGTFERILVEAADDDATAPAALLRLLQCHIGRFRFAHLQGPDVGLMAQCARICRDAGVPFLYSPRGSQAIIAREADAAAASRLRAANDFIVAHAAAICVTSDFEAHAAGELIGDRPLFVISNPANLTPFAPVDGEERRRRRAALSLAPERPVLLHFGRVTPEKNLAFLLDLLAALPPGETPADLHLVGPGAAAFEHGFAQRVATLGLSGRVIRHGPVSGANRGNWLAAADLVMIPSLSENFCLTLLEAAAIGAPALVSPHLGALQYVRNASVRVRPLEIPAWVEAVMSPPPLPDGDRWQNYIATCEGFSTHRIAREWLAALERLGWLRVGSYA